MKKILFLLLTIMIVGCNPKQDEIVEKPDKGKFNPQATITIRPAKGVVLRSQVTDLTALQIVEQALNIKWESHWFDNVYKKDATQIGRSFGERQKDFNIPALKMLGVDIITNEGVFYRDFIYGYNIVITDKNNDTIAYVPDSVVNTARPLIENAFADSNYVEVYRLFNEAFTFLPISK